MARLADKTARASNFERRIVRTSYPYAGLTTGGF
jgi:hypothetical protein